MKRVPTIAVCLVLGACTAGPATSQGPSASQASVPTTAAPTPSGARTDLALPVQLPSGQAVFAIDDPSQSVPHRQLYRLVAGPDPAFDRVVTSSDDDNSPSISPDGHTIVFDRQYPDHPGKASASFLVNVDGSALRPLDAGECTAPCIAEDVEADAWSPDGTQILLTRVQGDAAGTPTDIGIWLIDVQTGAGHPLIEHGLAADQLEDHDATWSSDGTRIAFQRLDEHVDPARSAIFVEALDGGPATQVTPWELNASDPDWSPDGEWIAFQSPAEAFEQPGEQNIYIAHPDGSGLRQVTSHLGLNSAGREGTFRPTWSPDGTMLLFTHGPGADGVADLYVVRADGSGLFSFETPTNEGEADWGVWPDR